MQFAHDRWWTIPDWYWGAVLNPLPEPQSPRVSGLTERDSEEIRSRYSRLHSEYGHSPAGAGWGNTDRQAFRYRKLMEDWDLDGRSVLDIGGGFGDGFRLAELSGVAKYHVVDLSPAHVRVANQTFGSSGKFFAESADFLTWEPASNYDLVLSSGMFNFMLSEMDNLDFIEAVVAKSMALANEGVSFNFLGEFNDWAEKGLYYTALTDLIPLIRSVTNRYVIRYDYLPYEFSAQLFPRGEITPSGEYSPKLAE